MSRICGAAFAISDFPQTKLYVNILVFLMNMVTPVYRALNRDSSSSAAHEAAGHHEALHSTPPVLRERHPSGFQVDGPNHFTSNSPLQVTATSRARERLVEAAGWRILRQSSTLKPVAHPGIRLVSLFQRTVHTPCLLRFWSTEIEP